MLKQYLSSTRHRATRFAAGMSPMDAEALCLEVNAGCDPAKSDFLFFNGAALSVIKPGGATLTVSPGNWVVVSPEGSLEVHADADFCSKFCPAAS